MVSLWCRGEGRGLPDRLSTVLLMSHLSVRAGAIQGDSEGKVIILAVIQGDRRESDGFKKKVLGRFST